MKKLVGLAVPRGTSHQSSSGTSSFVHEVLVLTAGRRFTATEFELGRIVDIQLSYRRTQDRDRITAAGATHLRKVFQFHKSHS